ncbi:MAG: RNA polymerase-binding protein DksA [Holosporaceae bacterium]|jgi:DnaK suppressor protein|nr:RNA polymerase-binding protein DksA [Holosporaceae bacterium]
MDSKICDLPENYVPSENEEFMNDLQREYFRRKLIRWRTALEQENEDAIKYLQQKERSYNDEADRASNETDLAYELRTKERARKLILKITDALQRISNGTYGYCEETGEPISLKRLDARPIAILSIEAQERHEKQERVQKNN